MALQNLDLVVRSLIREYLYNHEYSSALRSFESEVHFTMKGTENRFVDSPQELSKLLRISKLYQANSKEEKPVKSVLEVIASFLLIGGKTRRSGQSSVPAPAFCATLPPALLTLPPVAGIAVTQTFVPPIATASSSNTDVSEVDDSQMPSVETVVVKESMDIHISDKSVAALFSTSSHDEEKCVLESEGVEKQDNNNCEFENSIVRETDHETAAYEVQTLINEETCGRPECTQTKEGTSSGLPENSFFDRIARHNIEKKPPSAVVVLPPSKENLSTSVVENTHMTFAERLAASKTSTSRIVDEKSPGKVLSFSRSDESPFKGPAPPASVSFAERLAASRSFESSENAASAQEVKLSIENSSTSDRHSSTPLSSSASVANKSSFWDRLGKSKDTSVSSNVVGSEVLSSTIVVKKEIVYTAPDGTTFTDRQEYRDYLFNNYYKISKKKKETFLRRFGEIDGQPFVLEDLVECVVALADNSETVHVDRASLCTLLIAGSCDSVFLRNVRDSTVFVCCKQLRLRDCANVRVFAATLTDPVIEASHGILFGPQCAMVPYFKEILQRAHLDYTCNHWSSIFDFSKDDMALPVPHFAIMSPQTDVDTLFQPLRDVLSSANILIDQSRSSNSENVVELVPFPFDVDWNSTAVSAVGEEGQESLGMTAFSISTDMNIALAALQKK